MSGLPYRAVFITALPVEYSAVRDHLMGLREITHQQGTVYEVGEFEPGIEVAVVEVGIGNSSAAQEFERAVTFFEPAVVFFVGVGGGLKDVHLGDVVAATHVYNYEAGKEKELFFPRPQVGHSSYRMEQRARSEAKKKDWLRRIKGGGAQCSPKVFVGPLAAGEKVIASRDSTTFQRLRAIYGDALAVEMEGYGFVRAARAVEHVDALVVRGISDLLDDKASSDAHGYQDIAARNASAFAFQVLATLFEDTGLPSIESTLETLTYAGAESTIADLVRRHDRALILARIRERFAKEDDVASRAQLCYAASFLVTSEAETFLREVTDNCYEYEHVRDQARDLLEAMSASVDGHTPSNKTDDYDVFLCHNSEDKPEVRQIARRLRQHNVSVWLDEWELQPGLPWQKVLEHQIQRIRSAAVFVGNSSVGPWQNMELDAFIREFVQRKCPVVPVVLKTCNGAPRLPPLLNGMTCVDFRKRSPDPLNQLIWGVTGRSPFIDNNIEKGR